MKFCFVILHYLAYEMTSQCVKLLFEQFAEHDMRIVVVDNASSNGSGKRLKSDFGKNERVTVLLNEKNEGFARGNNVGYDFCKKTFSPDFIIVMNNDVLIRDKNFLSEIPRIYEETHFAVLGPDIFNPYMNKHQNPGMLHGLSRKEAARRNAKMKRTLAHFRSHYIRLVVSESIKSNKILKAIYRAVKYKIFRQPRIDYTKSYEDPHLHGSCYIFSKVFMERRKSAFNPVTFLYYEEDILHFECRSANLKMVYSPLIHVEHLEDVSTNLAHANAKEKEKFKLTEMIKSSDEFLRILDNTTQMNGGGGAR